MMNVNDYNAILEETDLMDRLMEDEESEHNNHEVQENLNIYQPTVHGDQFGDRLLEEKPPGRIRIYCINLNGIKWDNDGGTWPTVCQAMEASNVDIAGFAELNQDVGRYELQSKLDSICKKTFQQHQIIMSTSKHKVCRTYKPGGTAALVCNDMTALVKSWSRDRMGRWTSMRFSGFDGKYFTFIMAYQVCHTTTKGTNTAAAQQRASLIEESIIAGSLERLTPRQAFILDLKKFIQSSQQAGDAIILSGDFNETMSENNSGIARLACECGLVDIFSIRLGNDISPSTYQRGKKRLDFILISPSLTEAVIAAGYDPFGYRVVSDHRGYFIDLDANKLCGFTPTKLDPPTNRGFQSTNPQQLRVYLRTKHRYLRDHNWYKRVQELMEKNEPDHETAEALDRDLQRSSRCAANACQLSYRSPWSPKFALAWARINFYKLAKSQITNEQDYSPAIKRLQQKFPSLPSTIPTDPLLIKTMYQQALSSLCSIRQEASTLRENTFRRKQRCIPPWKRKVKPTLFDGSKGPK